MPEDTENGTAVENATITQAPPFEAFIDDDLSEGLLDPVGDDDGFDFTADLADTDEVDELPFEDVDDDDDDDFSLGDVDDIVAAMPTADPAPAAATDDPTAARLAQLEAAARQLAAAEVERENRRVKRKVTAATTGAGATGFIPILLGLAGVYHLDPTLTATISTVASLIGAFAAGWITPERTPPLPADSAHALLGLGENA